MKATLFNIHKKKADQRKAEINMTPLQRLDMAFELIELVVAFAPREKPVSDDDHSIKWIELKPKNGIEGSLY